MCRNTLFAPLRALGVVTLILSGLPSLAQAEDLLIFAAASMRDALEDVAEAWEGAPLAISYAGSAVLARQIEAGAPADIFISANETWVSHLVDQGAVDPARTEVIVSNQLVVAGPIGAVETNTDFAAALGSLPDDARIATGLLNAVPAGIYARQALEAEGLLDRFLPRLVQTDNVRIALALAARGDVARAIVYRTDALADPQVAIDVRIPAYLHDPIRYPAAVTAGSDHPDATALLDFLSSPHARAIFESHGFEVPR